MMTSSKQLTNTKMLSAAMLRLLPIQVLMVIPGDFGVAPEEKNKDEGKLGLRLVFGMAQDVQYQNILGLNILTIRIQKAAKAEEERQAQ